MIIGLSNYNRIREIHFTQIRRSILKIKRSAKNLDIDLDIDDDKKPITVISLCFWSYYNKKRRLQKWMRKKKEFIQPHIAVDTRSKIASFRVTKGNIHDSKEFNSII
jgi:hypothetical protein